MTKSIAIIDIRLWLYMHYHRKESLLNVFEAIRNASPLSSFTKIFFVYDNGKSSYHKALYPDYKENRTAIRAKQTDSEKTRYKQFSKEYNSFKEITALFGTNICIEGEADTYIEVLANKFNKDGESVYIFSGDSDFHCMLTSSNMFQVTPKGEVLDEEGVFIKKGVTPYDLFTSFCIAGQAKDNIKGVVKLGEIKDLKTGTILKKLLKESNSIDELLGTVQAMVDKGTRGMKLPEDYPPTTVRELYEFNKELNKDYTFDDLTDEHKQELLKQVNVKQQEYSQDHFDLLCWEHFTSGLVLSRNVLRFYKIKG